MALAWAGLDLTAEGHTCGLLEERGWQISPCSAVGKIHPSVDSYPGRGRTSNSPSLVLKLTTDRESLAAKIRLVRMRNSVDLHLGHLAPRITPNRWSSIYDNWCTFFGENSARR